MADNPQAALKARLKAKHSPPELCGETWPGQTPENTPDEFRVRCDRPKGHSGDHADSVHMPVDEGETVQLTEYEASLAHWALFKHQADHRIGDEPAKGSEGIVAACMSAMAKLEEAFGSDFMVFG